MIYNSHKWTTDFKWEVTDKVSWFWLWNIFMYLRSLNLNWLLCKAVWEACRTTHQHQSHSYFPPTLLPRCGEWLTGHVNSFCMAKWSLMTKGSKVVRGKVGERGHKALLRNLKKYNTTGKAAVVDRARRVSVATKKNMVHLRKSGNHSFIQWICVERWLHPGPCSSHWGYWQHAKQTKPMLLMLSWNLHSSKGETNTHTHISRDGRHYWKKNKAG